MQVSPSLQQELKRIARTSPAFSELYQELLAEGKAEGRLKGLRAAVQKMLIHRFPTHATDLDDLLPSCTAADLSWLVDACKEKMGSSKKDKLWWQRFGAAYVERDFSGRM
jgi:hypothetical protein